MRVLDTLGSITCNNTDSEQFEFLRKITSQDNVVHLTVEGYKNLSAGIYREAHAFGLAKTKGKNSLSGKHQVKTAEWRGFVSNLGIGKVSHPYLKKR
jgi:heme oxygenase